MQVFGRPSVPDRGGDGKDKVESKQICFNHFNFYLQLLSLKLTIQKTKTFKSGNGEGQNSVSLMKYDWK